MPSTEKLLSHERSDPLIDLAVITHPRIEPLRAANVEPEEDGSNDVFHQGERFLPFPFALERPGEGPSQQTGSIRIPNLDRRIGEGILAIAGQDPAQVRLLQVLASTPDEIEWSYARLLLRNVALNQVEVTGALRHPDLTSEPWPNLRVTPGLFRAIYRARG